MEWTIQVRAGIGHHLDLANLKLRARSVMFLRLFATEKVTDQRRRQASVSDQAVLDRVTEIDELFVDCHESHCSAEMRSGPPAGAAGSISDHDDDAVSTGRYRSRYRLHHSTRLECAL